MGDMLQRRVSACSLERQRREAEERRNKKAIQPVVIKENCKICLLGVRYNCVHVRI